MPPFCLSGFPKLVDGTPERPHHFADIAQLGERQTEDLKVPGSIPGVGNSFSSPILQSR